jgi:Flp pilus assembly protein TadB
MLKFEDPTPGQLQVVAAVAFAVALILLLTQRLWSAAPFALIAVYMLVRARSGSKRAK